MKYLHSVLSVSSLFLTMLSANTFAQRALFSLDSTQTPEVKLGEVVINASKDQSVLREMPAAVSLITSEIIEQNEIRTLSNISSTVPNLFMLDYGSKLQSPVFIRGIGSRLGIPSVGLYVDQVPHFEKTTFGFDFFDIDKIEVLRGPQGTLYGRNTMGGLINIVTKSPFEYQGTNVSMTAGDYGLIVGSVNHYQKIDDAFAFSLGLNYKKHDGYFVNMFNNDDIGGEETYNGRLRLGWKINDRLTLENITNVERTRQDGFPYALNHEDTATTEVNINEDSFYERDLISNGLILNYKNDVLELSSSSSIQYYDGLMSVDQDFTSDSIYFFDIGDKQTLFSQEVLVKSVQDKDYKWLFGVHGFAQDMDQLTKGDIYSYKMKQEIRNDFNIYGLAFFHQSTLENFMVDGLSVTAGVRFDMERDKLNYNFMQALGPQAFSTLSDTSYQEDFTEVLPKFTLKYDFDNETNIYASVTKGYKSGGFNTNSSVALDTTGFRSFDTEKSWNYELGLKTSALDHRLSADIALFYIDWSDQQIDVAAIGGRGNMKVNAGESVSKGLEVFVRALPGSGWEGTLSYGYTHATFANYQVSEDLSYTNNYIPYVPRHTLNLGVSKSLEFNGGLLEEMVISADYKEVGQLYWNLENSAQQDAYGLINGKLSFFAKGVQFDIWVKNILDTTYDSYYFVINNASIQNSYVQLGKPRTFGVNLSYKF